MLKKTPGKLNTPPPQAGFDHLPLTKLSIPAHGVYFRLHGVQPGTGQPWHPIYFSRQGHSRFDPITGPGTLYVGESLAGVLLEKFDDQWGAVNSTTRSLTQTQLDEWWVTLVAIPLVKVFDTRRTNLSKIGTDLQLLTGSYETSRRWALRLSRHPAKIGGILYPSRHNSSSCNLALFNHRDRQPEQFDARLTANRPAVKWVIDDSGPIVYGLPVLLRNHLDLPNALIELEVAILP